MSGPNWKNRLRPTVLVVISLAISLVIALTISALFPAPTHLDQFEELADRVSGLKHPNQDLSPEDVVRIQLDACANEDWGRGALQCMYFASPANRAITGPYERFGRMMRTPPFGVLSDPDQVLVGNAKLFQGTARVLVTIAKEQEISVFVWLLVRQAEPPYTGCWMTEAVFPFDQGPAERQPADSLDKVASNRASRA